MVHQNTHFIMSLPDNVVRELGNTVDSVAQAGRRRHITPPRRLSCARRTDECWSLTEERRATEIRKSEGETERKNREK